MSELTVIATIQARAGTEDVVRDLAFPMNLVDNKVWAAGELSCPRAETCWVDRDNARSRVP